MDTKYRGSRVTPLFSDGLRILSIFFFARDGLCACISLVTQSIVYDEANSYQLYLTESPLRMFQYSEANHHFIHQARRARRECSGRGLPHPVRVGTRRARQAGVETVLYRKAKWKFVGGA
jgi:hypothetical protein